MAIILSGTTGIDMGNTPMSNASQIEVQNNQLTPFTGFKNLIINGNKQVNQSGLTTTDNSYNYDNHYKAGNNWFMFIDGKSIVSGEPYTLSWEGVATVGYHIGTSGATTINAQTFTAIANGETIIPTITPGQILWIKFASDSSGNTYDKVQFEPGTVPTPYEQRLKELEEFLVQSCYEVIKIKDIRSLVGTYVTTLTLGCVEKRAIPIINWNFSTITNATSFSSSPTTNSINFSYAAVATSTCVLDGLITADARPY